MTNLKDVFYKLLFILFLISTLSIYIEYITNKKDIGRYVPNSGGGIGVVLDSKTGAVYKANYENKKMELLIKPISN